MHVIFYVERKMKDLYKWSKDTGYEVSTKGDSRFSAFCAYLQNDLTIEQAYQCRIKGYDPTGKNWRLGKGKPSLRHTNRQDLYNDYKSLWQEYFWFHPELRDHLIEILPSYEHILRDSFATSDINQARAIADILNQSKN